jgi:hypothetical protein
MKLTPDRTRIGANAEERMKGQPTMLPAERAK